MLQGRWRIGGRTLQGRGGGGGGRERANGWRRARHQHPPPDAFLCPAIPPTSPSASERLPSRVHLGVRSQMRLQMLRDAASTADPLCSLGLLEWDRQGAFTGPRFAYAVEEAI